MREQKLELAGRPLACADIYLLFNDGEQEPYGVRKDYRNTAMARIVAARETYLYRASISGPFPKAYSISDSSLCLQYIENSGTYSPQALIQSIAELHNSLDRLKVAETKSPNLAYDIFDPMDIWFEKVLKKLSNAMGCVVANDGHVRKLAALFKEFTQQRRVFIHGDICPNNIRLRDESICFIDFECLALGPIEIDLALPFKISIQSNASYADYDALINLYDKASTVGRVNKGSLVTSMIFDLLRRINCYADYASFDLAWNAGLLMNLMNLQGIFLFKNLPQDKQKLQKTFTKWVMS